MEIKGKIVTIYEPVSGQGANGPWTKQDFIMELPNYGSNYPDKLVVTAFGDAIALLGRKKVGQEVTASINFKVREVNGKAFQSNNLWRFVEDAPVAPAPATAPQPPAVKKTKPAKNEQLFGEEESDLPF